VPDAHDLDDDVRIVDRIDDAMDTRSDAVELVVAWELFAAKRARIGAQRFERIS
jgi:hypothetical protein